jgi:NAD(P)-dependent dehydrogenase (short-subunit alcohol dehydrogenase family)
MQFAGKTAIVTGAGQGIGRALACALSEQGVRVLVNDLSADMAKRVAHEIGGVAHSGDLREPGCINAMITTAEQAFGPVDMLFSNAGFALGEPDGPTSQSDDHWQNSWELHVMAHLRASRLLVPKMVARGSGVLVNVASAAGLLSQIGDAAYSATKHAAVSLAQSLAIEHGGDGIQVAVVCPLYVATPLLGYAENEKHQPPNGVITSEEVASSILDGLRAGQFLIYPHPEAHAFFEKRAADTDRWIQGMQRLRANVREQSDGTDPASIHRFI